MVLRMAVRTSLILLLAAALSPAAVMNFDAIAATCCFGDVIPGGPRGPLVTDGLLTVDGGVVMNNSGWLDLATTAPNLYGTSDYIRLGDQSLLPGWITGYFLSSATRLELDIINGSSAADFTVFVYDSLFNQVGSATIALGAFGSGPGAVGHVGFLGFSDIKYFEVLSGQAEGSIDFAIDTIGYDAAIPEPSTMALAAVGLALLGLRLRKRA